MGVFPITLRVFRCIVLFIFVLFDSFGEILSPWLSLARWYTTGGAVDWRRVTGLTTRIVADSVDS